MQIVQVNLINLEINTITLATGKVMLQGLIALVLVAKRNRFLAKVNKWENLNQGLL